MRLQKTSRLLLAVLLLIAIASCSTEKDHLVTIQTRFGDMKIILYDQTPKHKENFLRLAEEGHLDSTTFHRVIENFMIQGGDVNAKENSEEKINYTIEAEFIDTLIHRKGALAAARMGDQQNPTKASNGSQFYIVDGQQFTEAALRGILEDQYRNELQRRFGLLLQDPEYKPIREDVIALQNAGDMEGIIQKIKDFEPILIQEFGPIDKKQLTQQQLETYTTIGGSPHLDGEYTVFGQVIDGMAVIDSIASVPTGPGDKPLIDIYMTVEVEEMSKKKIKELYGYPDSGD